MKAEVLVAEHYEYTSKGGKEVKGTEVTFLDRCPHAPMKVTFDMRMDGQNVDGVRQLQGKTVELDVREFEIWNGRLRAQGQIASVPGGKAA